MVRRYNNNIIMMAVFIFVCDVVVSSTRVLSLLQKRMHVARFEVCVIQLYDLKSQNRVTNDYFSLVTRESQNPV
jgi:hypothetical protein